MKNFIKTFIFVAVVLTASFAMVGNVSAAIDDNSGTGCGGCGSTGGNADGGNNQGGGDNTPQLPICNYLNADKTSLPVGGGSVNLNWSTSRGTSATLTPTGSAVALNGSKTVNVTTDTTYVLRVSNSAGADACSVRIVVADPAVPSCDAFTANPTTLPAGGGNVLLTWATSNSNNVKLDGVAVSADGSKTVNVTATKTFTLTVANVAGSDSCTAKVTVPTDTPAPKCDSFTVSPTTLPAGGGNVTLTWNTTNAESVSINNGIGAVADDGSKTVNVTSNKTYTLTVLGKNGVLSDSCTASVTVATPNTLSCANNVSFKSNDYSLPKSGGDVTLTWSTTGLDTIAITSISNPGFSGSETVRVTSDKTFTLTGTADGKTISCPLSIDVATGGGGGGPAAPICDLDISDTKISRGQEIELEWDTRGADEIILRDNHDNEIINSDDRDDLDGSIKLRPTEDTTYELVAIDGNRKTTCREKVYVKDGVTVVETRNFPLVKGIALTQVPYTGFEAGPFLTTLFYILLTIWGLFVAYVVAVRRNMIGGISFAGAHDHAVYTDVSTAADPVDTTETIAQEYVASTIAAPTNLPTGAAPVFGYAAMAATTEDNTAAVDESIEMSELENRAHALKTLFSSDAMRYFMNQVPADGRTEAFDALVHQAKATFPSEDGWVVINLARLESLMSTDNGDESVADEVAPITSGSLAEAIVTGNIVAAYQMISNRPMIALADAAAELDSVVRARRGDQVQLSTLLATETAALTDEQIAAAIHALTGALDGVYTTEEEAVKMAIMKAVKAIV